MTILQFNDPGQVLHWLTEQLGTFGLQTRGCMVADATLPLPPLTTQSDSLLVLIGHAGSGFWPFFTASQEYADGQDHPLDRWSQRVGDTLAGACNGQAWYPFSGPPYQPFQQWADRCEPLTASPLGLRLHSEFGLWHAYRFALQVPLVAAASHGVWASPVHTTTAQPPVAAGDNICQTCVDQPCLNACPVDAFTPEQYDLPRCTAYLHNAYEREPEAFCVTHTCQARWACPVGVAYRYSQAHGQFHMRQFVLQHPRPHSSITA